MEQVVEELQACLDQSEFPVSKTRGSRPLRASGTRFVAHKVVALERFIDRFGAYLNHLTSLVEDFSTKPVDKQKLKGYIKQWKDAKILLGCACFHDILKPAAILCKVLQNNDLCIVSAIEAVLRTVANIERLRSTEVEEFSTVKKVLLRVKEEPATTGSVSNGSEFVYQGIELLRYHQGLAFLKHHKSEYVGNVLACLKDRLKDRESARDELLTHALKIVATHGWEKSEGSGFGYSAIEALSALFSTPLQDAGVDSALLQQEWDDMVYYAKQYLNLVTDPYRVVWWKLFNSSDSSKWRNILVLVEPIFTLPISNGRLERCFSQMKLIKTNRRSCLGEDRLDHLLRIQLEGPSLEKWDAGRAVELWWKDKTRRINRTSSQSVTKEKDSGSRDKDAQTMVDFSDWETWLGDYAEQDDPSHSDTD